MVVPADLRQMVGPRVLALLDFTLAEASVAAAAALTPTGKVGGSADGYAAPYAGDIIGVMWASEASADFTLQPTIDATPDATESIAIDAVSGFQILAASVAFVAGELLGLDVIVDTVSKDINCQLIVVFDI